MLEIKIRNKIAEQWQGTQDNNNIKDAIETAITFENINNIDKNWQWLAHDLSEICKNHPTTAITIYNYIRGWLDGASHILNKAFQNLCK